jgi:hypothetical protein
VSGEEEGSADEGGPVMSRYILRTAEAALDGQIGERSTFTARR